MELFGRSGAASFLVEEEAYPGVVRIAGKVAKDMEWVSGKMPQMIQQCEKQHRYVVLFATIGKSPLLEQLEQEGKISLAGVRGKREVYGIRLLTHPIESVEELLVIYGSDKRGTIYGMFWLSEQMGVSPLVYWGDAVPERREQMEIDKSVEFVSKEPSVRYRGFFINDEWPCFGNWTFEHYHGFTAEMYDQVFELLLRLKGNYLWPAMWTSSFALDGPGEESAALADLYGVVMGNSHHEPCLRAGEEWDIYRGKESDYGNEWNYLKNREGLLRYWRDGLLRSGKYESIITIGMRGERDSMMEGPSTLKENIDILKDIIAEQKKLIKETSRETGREHPMLLALYKEVERYFYSEKGVEGLREWDGLSDVILMLCEDNFGHMRTLPDENMRKHKGGYGMYFHLDYHGGPVSYEWINSTPLSLIWEQMTPAYEYGVQEVWMVNVGDLKGNEFPLSYFMELAYDYERWGSTNPDSTKEYTKLWVRQQFGMELEEQSIEKLAKLMTDGVALIARHRPEALGSTTYHPVHYSEAERVLAETETILKEAEELHDKLPDNCRMAYESMFYYYLLLGCNLVQMQIHAGKNEHYARCGKKAANSYAKLVEQCIKRDRELVAQFGLWNQGKWQGMAAGNHVGFQKWNEDGCRYPLRMYVEPFSSPRMVVSRSDGAKLLMKNYGRPDAMEIRDFLSMGTERVEIEIANTGTDSFDCQIEMEDCPWLFWEMKHRKVEEQEILSLVCRREALPEEETCQVVRISDGDTVVELLVYGKRIDTESVPERTFFARKGIFSIEAGHYAKKLPGQGGEDIVTLFDFGLCGSGIKADSFAGNYCLGEGPAAGYYLSAEEEGDYILEIWSAPNNPVHPGMGLPFAVGIGQDTAGWEQLDSVAMDYEAGEPGNKPWAEGVIAQIHKTKTTLHLKKGMNEIYVGFLNGVFVLEKLVLYPENEILEESCMGPTESWCKISPAVLR